MAKSLDNPDWLRELHAELNIPRERALLLLAFFINDFCSLWNSLAKVSNEEMDGRSNFLFAKEAMRLLELICRGCTAKNLLEDFSRALEIRNPHYFIHTPLITEYAPLGSRTVKEGVFSGIELPKCKTKKPILLWLLFDVVRNGIAHSGIQNSVAINGTTFYFSLSGNQHLGTLLYCENDRKFRSLRWEHSHNAILIFPETLFLDFVWALKESKIYKDSRFILDYPGRIAKADQESFDKFKNDLNTLKIQ